VEQVIKYNYTIQSITSISHTVFLCCTEFIVTENNKMDHSEMVEIHQKNRRTL